MKKIKIVKLSIIISFVMLIIFVFANSKFVVFALDNKLREEDITLSDKLTQEVQEDQSIFKNKVVDATEYVYNLDDQADYIYVQFKNEGYALYAKETMEILEYSLQGRLPYLETTSKKYYAGPTHYMQKINNQFFNVVTGNQFKISKSKAMEFAVQIRQTLVNQKVNDYNLKTISDDNVKEIIHKSTFGKLSSPDIDSRNLIIPTGNNGKLIPNAQYFLTNPTHGDNFTGGSYGNGNSGTCGAVAAQLLLGYNNYYNDRRIIEDRFLNGFNDASNSVTNPERNPNHSVDPMSMTRWTTGTRSEDTGANSFYSNIVTTIMPPNTIGASVSQVRNGINTYLNGQLSIGGYTVKHEVEGWFFGWSPISPTKIKAEIDAGRPLIISMASNLGGNDHFVVGYGYEDYTYPNGEGTYSGYVVHFGWQGDNNVWINSSWCDGYISLKINHTHIYSIDTGVNYGIDHRIYRCACGHRGLIKIEPPAHSYTHIWMNLRQHESRCSCGDTSIRGHVVSSDWNGMGQTTCLDCGGSVEFGFIIQNINTIFNEDMIP